VADVTTWLHRGCFSVRPLVRENEVVEPLPHGYTNDTRADGSTVLKRYQGPEWQHRRGTENAALARLAGVIPVPRVISSPPGALRMEFLAGIHGQVLVDAGHAAAVLDACGVMLRQIQAIHVTAVFPNARADAQVLVHGDYGPNNMLFDPATFAIAGVVDWEWAHAGDAIEDLAWCEWIIRMHHPEAVGALQHLFAGYGEQPSWSERQAAALRKCHEMLNMPRIGGMSDPGAHRWRRNIDVTLSWTE
jgi:Ser/Thr protein kinase RdoA (MazF antagonist)